LKIDIGLDSLIDGTIISSNTAINAVKNRAISSRNETATEHGREIVHRVLFIGGRTNLQDTKGYGIDGLE